MNFRIREKVGTAVLICGVGAAILLCASPAGAQTWVNSPDGNWNTASNWSPASVPDSASANATFGASSVPVANLNADVDLDSLVLTSAAPSYTVVNNGHALSFDGAGILNQSTSTLTLDNAGSGSLNFNGSSTAGNANIFNADTGSTLTFADSSSAGNGAVTNNGSLVFESYATAGSAAITSVGGASVSFNDGSSAGHSTIINSGSLNFTGDNAVTSATAGNADITNNGGSVTFGDGSTAGSATIHNDGLLVFSGDDAVTFSSAGSSKITNTNIMYFLGSSTAGNAGITNGGFLSFEENSTAGSASIINEGADSVSFADGATAGNSTIASNGNIYFQGDNSVTVASAGSAVITNSGTGGVIHFDDNSTAGNAVIITDAGAHVIFQGHADGGTASFTVNSEGLAQSTFDISQDVNPVAVGSVQGSGLLFLGDDNLTTGGNNSSGVLSGTIADGGIGGGTGGSLTKEGTGILTLTGDNSYTGGTNLNDGILLVGNDNALGTGVLAVNNGTTLGFTGPIHLNLGGDYTQASNGTLQLGLGGAGANQWDELILSGSANADLDGDLEIVSQGHVDRTYVVLSTDTGTITGTWSGSVTDLVAGDSVSVFYGSDAVSIETFAPTFTSLALTANQTAIAQALDLLAVNSEDSGMISVLNAIPNASLPAAYDQISPSSLTALYRIGFSLAQAQAGIVGGRLSQVWGDSPSNSRDLSWNENGPLFAGTLPASREAAMAKKDQADRWGVFADGLAAFGTVSSDGNGAGYQFSTGGTTAGLDHWFAKDLVGGLLLGYSGSGTSQSKGQVTVTGAQAGIYAGWRQDQFHLNALVEGGLNNYATNRQSVGGTASGTSQGTQFTGQLGEDIDWKLDQTRVSLFASEQYTIVSLNGFTETGSSTPLTVPSQNEGDFSADLGVKAGWDWNLGGLTLSPALSAAWEHEFQSDNVDSLNAGFAGAGSDGTFTVNGPDFGTDAAVLGGGLDARFAKGFDLYAQYQGKLGMTNFTSQSLTGGVHLEF